MAGKETIEQNRKQTSQIRWDNKVCLSQKKSYTKAWSQQYDQFYNALEGQ